MSKPGNQPTHLEMFSIASSHPALPGHFPNAPIVPGVLLLDRAVSAIQRVWMRHVCALPQVKFMRPLLPDQPAQLTLIDAGSGVRFEITHNAQIIANGLIELAP